MKIYGYIIALIIILLTGCDREDLFSVVEEYSDYNIYTFGQKGNAEPYSAVSWKNFSEIAIDQPPAGKSPYFSRAFSDNRYVYAVGMHATTGGNVAQIACYWRNGKLIELSSTTGSRAYSGCTAGGKLYILGVDSGNCLWIDGVKYTLTLTPAPVGLYDVAVSKSAILITGTSNYSPTKLAVWTIPFPLPAGTALSGSMTDLNGANYSSSGSRAYVIDDVFYITGMNSPVLNSYYPSVWINNIQQNTGNLSASYVSTVGLAFYEGMVMYFLLEGSGSSYSMKINGTAYPFTIPAGYSIAQSFPGGGAGKPGMVAVFSASNGTKGDVFAWIDGSADAVKISNPADTVNGYSAMAVTQGLGW